MRFVFLRSEICRRLPSDSTSRWTPLLFGYTLPTIRACSGLSPVRARPWRANKKEAAAIDRLRYCFCSSHLDFRSVLEPEGNVVLRHDRHRFHEAAPYRLVKFRDNILLLQRLDENSERFPPGQV